MTREELLNIIETDHVQCGEAAALARMALAFYEWHEKTAWVQTDKRFDVLKPWGKHRADVLKEYIEHLENMTMKTLSELPNAETVYARLSDHDKWSTSLENVNHVLNACRAAMLAPATLETDHVRK